MSERAGTRFERGLLSSDSHIIEPPDLWTSRIDNRFKDRAPRVERIEGNDWWVQAGSRIGSVSGRKKRSGSIRDSQSIDSKGEVLTHSRFENVDPAAYTPSLYIDANLIDGVVGVVIRPTQGITNYCIKDDALFGAICRTYNDWICEFCSEDPNMLKAVAMLNCRDPKDAALELERVKKMNMAGAMIAVYPDADRTYAHPDFDILWATAEALQMPLSLHVLSNHDGPYGVNFMNVTYSLRANADYWVRLSLSDMIFAGVLERFPGLILETSEHEANWIPYFLWQMDWIWDRRIRKRNQSSATPHPPSHYFRRSVYASIIYDRPAVEAREQIGVDKMMWGSDYPHEQSTQPTSLTFVDQLLEGVPQAEQEMIVFENCAKLFGFEPDRLPSPPPSATRNRLLETVAC